MTQAQKRAAGDLVDARKGVNPLGRLFAGEGERSRDLETFLRHGPSGERDVEPLLKQMAAARAKNERWLREVLDACPGE